MREKTGKFINCSECDKSIYVNKRKIKHYCSYRCYNKNRKKLPRKIINCQHCKKEILIPEHCTTRFCSKNCWYSVMGEEQKGHIVKESTKKKISKSNSGKVRTEEVKRKLSLARKGKHSGDKCVWWKGGISTEDNRLRHSEEMGLWRLSVYERDKFTCQKCHKIGGQLNPHHIRNFSSTPKLRFVTNNGITLCQKCHRKFHHKYGTRNNSKKQIIEFIN